VWQPQGSTLPPVKLPALAATVCLAMRSGDTKAEQKWTTY